MSNADALEELFAPIDAPFSFNRRPDPVPADLRWSWRVPSLALLLSRCRGSSATLKQVHILGWGMRNAQTRQTFIRWARGQKNPDDIIVRFDPSLSRTIDLALGAGLATKKGVNSVGLTADGTALARRIDLQPEILKREKEFFSELPRKISQKYVDEVVAWRFE